jgi:hypothetical protein
VQLEATICDVWGAPMAGAVIYHTKEGGGLEVTEPLNDSRTARLTLDANDHACRHARPLDRVLSVTYGPYLIFKGPILQVATDYQAGTVSIAAHDATIRLKHHYHRRGDAAVERGYPVSGHGMHVLVESATPTQSQLARGVPPSGILWGWNSSTPQGPRPANFAQPQPGDGIWRKIEPGTNVWESVLNLSQALIGPDFRFRPVDNEHPGKREPGEIPPGFYCQLDNQDRLGEDRSQTVIFEHGLGADNAENLIHEPDGDIVRNWWRQVFPGGERGRADDHRRAVAQHNASMNKYGLMQGWESSGQRDSKAVLRLKAQAWVQAYHEPPEFFTVVPRIDSGANVPTFRSDYNVGDTITARARNGYREVELEGRIISAVIASVDQAANARVTLECVPTILDDLDITEEE